MPLFAIKKLPLNTSSMVKKIDNPMSTRTEIGEFEVEAGSIEEVREIAKNRVSSTEPHMICPWRDETKCFTVGAGRERDFVHPIILYRYNGSSYAEIMGKCHKDLPKSGCFMSKIDAKKDYLKHKALADEKLRLALEHLQSMKNLGVSIDYTIEGDTHGIHEDFMYLEVTEGAYNFTIKYSS